MSEDRAAAIERLRHMVEALDAIIAYTKRGRELLDKHPAVRDAILYQIVVLGEAADGDVAWTMATAALPELRRALRAALQRLG